MRRLPGLLLLLTGLLVGCATGSPERSTSWLNRLRPLHPGANPKVVQLEVALIERPVGDRYINEQLWDAADEQVIPFERKDLMADNGLRIGLLSGMPPSGLQALLTSERSCANPRRIQRPSGDPTSLSLGLTIPQCRFQVLQEGEWATIELEQAQCTLQVTPTLSSDGRTRLQFTPQVRHGQTLMKPRPSVDRSGTYSWMLQEHRPTETYASLGWEVTMAANEFVIVGGRLNRPQTLGHQFFIRGDEPNPVQRLLVIRTARTQPSPETEDKNATRSPPLALQAAMSGKEK